MKMTQNNDMTTTEYYIKDVVHRVD